ncbi:hypothetical protein H9Q08_17365 [Chryseobacterium sp. PS-8]|uniref:Uncharacterized protein n=1 Tax=Chryseobacterium indicum TaxID=2766954 RepID=A0ABS9C906_9FLAO|nr:hypothetical protein [Chryseobacterium sp. PS-8]MCF2221058.1 hypothetical protein [Chryseobacterium sp. PS-8]
MKIDPEKVPVMKSFCSTCPFKPDGKGRWQDPKLANEVIVRTLFKSHQICHGTEGENREPRFRCKGAFEHNLEIYRRLGLDDLIK